MVVSGIGYWMWKMSDPPIVFSDFTQAYYPAGRAILADIPTLYHRIAACEEAAICGFVNIPIVAFVFAPLSTFTLPTAQLLFALLSLAGVVLTIYMLWSMSEAPLPARCTIAVLFVFNGPLFYSLKEGNLTHFALLLLVAAFVCLDKERDRWAGALLALAAVLKLPLLLLGLYFAIKGRWRVVAGFASALMGVAAASLLYAGWTSHVEWYREAVQPFANKGLSAFNVQSFDAFLLRLHEDAKLYDWKPADVVWQLRMLRYALAAGILGVSCRLFMRTHGPDRKKVEFLELSMVLCVALIISPISWTHYYLLLLLPLCLYAGNRLPMPQYGAWLGWMGLCALLISPPVTFVPPMSGFWGQIIVKLFVSHYLAGAVLLLILLGYARLKGDELQEDTIAPNRSLNDASLGTPAFTNLGRPYRVEIGGFGKA
jgi:hypothetical protein